MESLGKLFETDKLVSLAINIIINCIFFYLNKRKIDVLEEQNLILMERVNNLEKNLSNLINFINGGQISPVNQSPLKPNITPTQSITNQKNPSVQLPAKSIQTPKGATSGLRKSLIQEGRTEIAEDKSQIEDKSKIEDKSQIEDKSEIIEDNLDQILEEEEEKERLLNDSFKGNSSFSEIKDPDSEGVIISNTQIGLINPEKKKSYAGIEIDE